MLGFPSLGGWGALLHGVGGWALAWGVGPAGLLVRALGKYLDPTGDRDVLLQGHKIWRGSGDN